MKNLKNLARLTGIGYLVIFIAGFYANFYVLEGLLVPNDPFSTFQNITNNLSGFEFGLAAFVIMVVIDLLLAWPLYVLLRTTNNEIAVLSSLLRVLNALFFFIALENLGNLYYGIQSGSILPAETLVYFDQFNITWTNGLLVFGVHLMVMGLLLYRSLEFPKILGVLITIAGLGYLVDCSAQLFLNSYDDYRMLFETVVISTGVIGEFSLTLYLLIAGIRSPKMIPSLQH